MTLDRIDFLTGTCRECGMSDYDHYRSCRLYVSDGCDIPGPIDWRNASHSIKYDNENFTVETWCKMGPEYKFRLRTRVRPMRESEVIHAKLRDHSREAVLKAYGVSEPDAANDYVPASVMSRLWFGNKRRKS